MASLGNSDNAIASYREALRTALTARARMPGEESTRTVIGAYQQLGQLKTFSGDLEDARDLYQRCLLVAREFVQQKPDDPARNQLLAATYMGLGWVQFNSVETDKAVQSLRSALQVFGTEPNGNEDHDRMLLLVYSPTAFGLNELGPNPHSFPSFHKPTPNASDVARNFPSFPPNRATKP